MDKIGSESNLKKRSNRYYTYIEPIIYDPVIRGYFTLVASILLTAFFILFALSPTFTTIIGLVRKIEDQKKVITAMDSKINNLIVAQEKYSQVESLLPHLYEALPETPLPDTVITGVLKVSSSSGVVPTAFKLGDVFLKGEIAPEEKPMLSSTLANRAKTSEIFSLGIPLMEFNMTVTGDTEDIRNFASLVQNLPRIVSLSSFSLTTDVTGQSKLLTGELTGVAYYLVSKEESSK